MGRIKTSLVKRATFDLFEKHPDKLSNCRSLMYDCNVSYINTDFPPDFYYD